MSSTINQKSIQILNDIISATDIKPTIIIKTKSFYYDQLILQLQHDLHFDIYQITIFDVTNNTTHNIYSMFVNLTTAENKFNSINL